MNKLYPAIVIAGAALLVAAAQDKKPQEHGTAEAGMGMAMAQPAPQHRMLAERIGTWNADFELMMGPEPIKSKATMTYEAVGPFWIVGRYEGEMMGMPFKGLELTGWDPEKEQFVSYWVDSMEPTSSVSRGAYDTATKTMTMTSRGKDHMTGTEETIINKTVFEGMDKLVFTMRYESAADPVMKIVYTRKK